MKILFKNITDYTKENCNNFREFHINKYAKKELFKYIFAICIAIYMLISNIIYKNWLLFVVILAGTLFIIIYLKYKLLLKKRINKLLKNRPYDRYKYMPSETNKQKVISREYSLIPYKKKRKSILKNKNAKEYIFYFYDNYMKIKNRSLSKKVWYYKFKKVYETEDYFFMYVDDREPWMLEKNGFVIGNSEKFAEFIKKKCIFRYKNEQ